MLIEKKEKILSLSMSVAIIAFFLLYNLTNLTLDSAE